MTSDLLEEVVSLADLERLADARCDGLFYPKRDCPNPPVWIARRPCCAASRALCSACREYTDEWYNTLPERVRLLESCPVCGACPLERPVFVRA